MDDMRRQIEEFVGRLERANAQLVQMQLTLQRSITVLSCEFSGSRRAEVQGFLDDMARAREGYSRVGDVIWQVKERLEEYASSL